MLAIFFFQAEDGIRDYKVTGVQTCALPIYVGFRADDEEGRAEREGVEAFEIPVPAVHDVECPGLRQNLVEDVDVVYFAAGNADERGDVAVQIQQRVHLHGGFVPPKFGPREQRKAQVNGGRVQRV